MAGKVLVTPRSLTRDGHPALEKLRSEGFEVLFTTPGVQPDEGELMRKLPGCVGHLAGVETISCHVLASAKDLKVISRNGTGIDNIDLEAAKALGILICRAEGANARGVAELTIGLILSLARSIPFSDAVMKNEQWNRRQGFEIMDKTLGVIGLGKIGAQVADMAASLGMRVLPYDPFVSPSGGPVRSAAIVSFDEVLKHSDTLTLHCPAPTDGKPILGMEQFQAMKKGVFIVNTARSSLIDGEALLECLENGQVSGAALDVFEKEPPLDWRLVRHSRVIATPHIGGFTRESVERSTEIAVENLLKNLK